MKKLCTENNYKIFNKRSARKKWKRKIQYKKWKRDKRKFIQGLSKEQIRKINKFKDFESVKAPEIFSFITNPNETIDFINKIENLYYKRKKTFINISNVKELDYSAITVLVSIMFSFKTKNIQFGGNYPKNEELKKQLINSGYFKYFNKPIGEKIEYTIGKPNQIFTRANKKVNSELGMIVMQEASNTIWGEKRILKGLQRVLLELMQNTNNHADLSGKGKKYWWLSVNHDKHNKKVRFTFVDYGVGIFKSLNSKPRGNKWFGWYEKIKDRLKYGDNKEILQKLLEGELHLTVTGEHFRGKGLPGIKEVQDRNQISNLHIITNNVFANIEDNRYKKMKSNFSGTFVSWEINNKNESLKWTIN